MKKIFAAFILFLLLCTFLCSCSSGLHVGTAMGAVTYYAVPTMGSVDMRGQHGEKIEQDTYGRTLYVHTKCDTNGEVTECVWIIYQKYDDDYVYYYEDICYTLSYDLVEKQEAFKTSNDWNQPLDESKMSRRKVYINMALVLTHESMLEEKRVESAWRESMNIKESQEVSILMDDVNPAGQCAYIVNLTNAANETDHYYVIAQPDYEVKSMPFDDLEDLFAKVSAFKKECGWVYGW